MDCQLKYSSIQCNIVYRNNIVPEKCKILIVKCSPTKAFSWPWECGGGIWPNRITLNLSRCFATLVVNSSYVYNHCVFTFLHISLHLSVFLYIHLNFYAFLWISMHFSTFLYIYLHFYTILCIYLNFSEFPMDAIFKTHACVNFQIKYTKKLKTTCGEISIPGAVGGEGLPSCGQMEVLIRRIVAFCGCLFNLGDTSFVIFQRIKGWLITSMGKF